MHYLQNNFFFDPVPSLIMLGFRQPGNTEISFLMYLLKYLYLVRESWGNYAHPLLAYGHIHSQNRSLRKAGSCKTISSSLLTCIGLRQLHNTLNQMQWMLFFKIRPGEECFNTILPHLMPFKLLSGAISSPGHTPKTFTMDLCSQCYFLKPWEK